MACFCRCCMGSEFSSARDGGPPNARRTTAGADPGPLSDAECGGALKTLDSFASKGELGSFRGLFPELGHGFEAALFRRVRGSKDAISAQRWVDFAGETLRGSSSKSAEAFICAALCVSGLFDDQGTPARVSQEALHDAMGLFAVLAGLKPTESGPEFDASPFAESAKAFYDEEVREGLVEGAVAEAVAVFDGAAEGAAEGDVAEGVAEAVSASTGGGVAVASVVRWAARHCGAVGDLWVAFARPRILGTPVSTEGLEIPCDAKCKSEVLLQETATQRAASNQMLVALVLHLGADSALIPRPADAAPSTTAPSSAPGWGRLYSSGQDGLSFYRLTHSVVGYGGPSILLCKSVRGDVFGVYADAPWKEAIDFFGGSDCFVFALRPVVRICRPRRGAAARREFCYLNLAGATRVRGLCAGGSGGPVVAEKARLRIPEQLGDAVVEARGSCLTYEVGDLAPSHDPERVELQALEVWGLGGAAAAKGRLEAQKARAQYIDKTRKVDKAAFFASDFDREHLLGKTFAGGATNR
ncbi:TLD-domain-containing protein [Pelagophyceae sp. CCMP2097]|nr:TLD-domain-containing protein [Pelagophyceae sp. CCMP2097]